MKSVLNQSDVDNAGVILRELWSAKSMDLHMCDGSTKTDQVEVFRDIRDLLMKATGPSVPPSRMHDVVVSTTAVDHEGNHIERPISLTEKGAANALADLEEVRKAVFGDVGDEPNVYADFDRCSELGGKMRRSIAALETTLAESVVVVETTEVDAEGNPFKRAISYKDRVDLVEELSRPIVGITMRTPQEAFDIMVYRVRKALGAAIPAALTDPEARL
ncbi:hypothetical protein [Rhizobium phage RHph_X2_30]|nr:hypothetical protein [Rhizobium phage RHph_X2_30]